MNWHLFWMAYAAVGIVVEIVALIRSQKEDTASETVWWLRGRKLNTWRVFIVLAAMVWATLHFAFGWFT